MMDRFATRAVDTTRQTVIRVTRTAAQAKERWTHLPYRRYLLPAAGLFAAVALAAPLLHFAGSHAGPAPQDVATRVTQDVPATLAAAVDAPAPQVVEILPLTAATDKRVARIEQGLETNIDQPKPQVAALPDDDPRWARVATAAPSAGAKPGAAPDTIETAELRSKLEQLQAPAPGAEAAVIDPAAQAPATDATFTGTIPPRSAGDSVRPAEEPVEEVAAVVPAQEAPPEEIAAVVPAPEEPMEGDAAAPGRAAQIKTHVNMRSGPENEAAVLTVLPGGTSINVIGGCEHWCEVDFDGKRGYVYKSFISGS